MAVTKRRVIDIAEDLDWRVTFDKERRRVYNGGKWDKWVTEKYVEFERESPAGEDFIFTVFYDNLHDLGRAVFEYADGFDCDDHAVMLYEAGQRGFAGVPDLRTLAEDAHDIEDLLYDLAFALMNGCER